VKQFGLRLARGVPHGSKLLGERDLAAPQR
jgi:hypothetical protein